MGPVKIWLWGVIWLGQLSFAASCLLKWSRLPHDPWYSYPDTVTLMPLAISLALLLVTKEKAKVAALISWVPILFLIIFFIFRTMNVWVHSNIDANYMPWSSYVGRETVRQTLMSFGIRSISIGGLSIIVIELVYDRIAFKR